MPTIPMHSFATCGCSAANMRLGMATFHSKCCRKTASKRRRCRDRNERRDAIFACVCRIGRVIPGDVGPITYTKCVNIDVITAGPVASGFERDDRGALLQPDVYNSEAADRARVPSRAD